jgi:hypothetical protein
MMPRQARARGAEVTAVEEPTVPSQRGPHEADQVAERPHLMTIAMGLFDARVSGVDFFDTEGGREVTRMYHKHQLRRRATHQPKTPKNA